MTLNGPSPLVSEPLIIFEDESILVLNKPAGLVVDKSETRQENTVENWLAERFPKNEIPRVGIVHRLDKDTSGVLLVAKTGEALENLQSQFKERVTKKEYLTLVHGALEKGGVVEGNIGRNPGNREKFIVTQQGKEASTEYEPIKLLVMSSEFIEKIFEDYSKIQLKKLRTMNYQLFTLLKCKPLTGRTHQIRVHLKHIGFPLVADEKYAGRKTARLDRRWCPRQFLHAAKIGFNHPDSGDWIEFESPLPDDLEKALSKLTS